MIARSLALVAALLLGPAAALPSHGQAQVPERATFLLQRAGTTLGVERITRTADRLDGEVQTAAGQRTRYRAELGEGATVTGFRVEVFAPGTPEGGSAARTVSVRFQGDIAAVDVAVGGQTQTRKLPTRAGAVPMVGGSVALPEQLLRRARVLGGGRVEVPTLRLDPGQTRAATVVFVGRDSARIETAGGTIRVRVDPQLRIVGGRDASDQLSIERREGHVGPTFTGPERASLPTLPVGMPARQAVDSLARHVKQSLPLAALSALVLRRGDTLLTRGYGVEDVQTREAATPRTLYHFGSVGKQFTAAAVLQLAEQGKLSLDDPITKYVPSYEEGAGRTLRHLLTMTSGIPNYTKDRDVRSDSTLTHAEVVAAIRRQEMEFGAGERFHYSNSNYYLLGMVIEEVSGRAYREYLQAEVLDRVPGGELYACAAAPDAGRARPYLSLNDELVAADPPVDYAFAAGSVCGSVQGLAAWARALQARRVVSRASLEQMTTAARLSSGQPTGYGFGVYVDTVAGHPVVWHGGLIAAYEAYLAWYPADDVIVALATNTISGEISNMVTLGGAVGEHAIGVADELRLSPARLERFTGTYALREAEVRVRVFVRDGQLHAERGGQQAFALAHRGGGRFSAVMDPSVHFRFGGEGERATTLTVTDGGKSYRGERVE